MDDDRYEGGGGSLFDDTVNLAGRLVGNYIIGPLVMVLIGGAIFCIGIPLALLIILQILSMIF
ncbi:MAG: hypothetical protein KDA95_11455 [Acidimicrobiales bacterium]|nr:hypothetical protein [Acidimicrobiales bacterium]